MAHVEGEGAQKKWPTMARGIILFVIELYYHYYITERKGVEIDAGVGKGLGCSTSGFRCGLQTVDRVVRICV